MLTAQKPAAARARPGRRGGVGDRAHLRRHHRGLRGARDARKPEDATLAFYEKAQGPRGGRRPRRGAHPPRRDPPTAPRCSLLDDGLREGTLGSIRSLDTQLRGRRGRRPSGRASRGRCSWRACGSSPRSSRPRHSRSWWARATWPCRMVTLGARAGLPDHRDRRPAALRDPRAFPRRGRPQDRHPVRAGQERARSSPRPRWSSWPTTTSTTCPCCAMPSARPWDTSGCSGSSRRGAAILNLLREDGVGEDALTPGARAHRPRPGRAVGAGDRAEHHGRDAAVQRGRHRDADQREGPARAQVKAIALRRDNATARGPRGAGDLPRRARRSRQGRRRQGAGAR